MFKKFIFVVNLFMAIAMILALFVVPASAYPLPGDVSPRQGDEDTIKDRDASGYKVPKPIDKPNPIAYRSNQARARLLDAGMTAEAAALAETGTANVLVLLVEFDGTDVFTWTQGVDSWDPLGMADPDEFTGVVGDCSNIITETQTFTYTGPMHNELPRPLSPDDRSGDSIWTEDFSNEWYEDFMFGQGVVFNYTMDDGTPVFEDFTGQSVTDYYLDMSNDVYTVTGDVVGWLAVDHSTWYYDADECPGGRSGTSVQRGGMIPGAGSAKDLLTDALDKVNEKITAGELPGFSWTDYDGDGDGIIDSLWLVHSGYGEEESDILLNRSDYGEAAVWSHSSAIMPYQVDPVNDISAYSYIMMPENGGMAVFAHEFAHNIGADDLYTYGYGNTSAGFWTLMADSWVDYPIGFGLTSFDPWHMDYYWGWMDDTMMVITDTSQAYEFYIGQASQTPEDTYRAAKIMLPEGTSNLAVPVWDGDFYWWGGKENVANAMMTTVSAISVPGIVSTATLNFDMAYDIEDEWDFLWVQASIDLGTTWDTLTNTNTQCTHDSGWIGEINGFPADLCAANIGGYYGHNPSFPAPDAEEFDLSMYAGNDVLLRFWYMTDWGSLYNGPFIDNVQVLIDDVPVFSDGAELGDANWTYAAPWVRSEGYELFSHNYYLQWRNTNDNGGYDRSLGDSRWRFAPANNGLVTWYNNNFYTDNEIYNYLEDGPSFGPKGRMLVLDSHPEPWRDPNDSPSWLGAESTNVTSRALMNDAPFTLANTNAVTLVPPSVISETTFSSQPAVSVFHDSKGYYPGVGDEGDGTYWSTLAWDASSVVPAKSEYTVAGGSSYPGYHIQYVDGGWLGFWGAGTGGSGNPADVGAQYGWHVEVLEEAADQTWAKVRVWNSMYAIDSELTADKMSAAIGDTISYTLGIENTGTMNTFMVCVPLDTDKFEFVGASAGALLMEECPSELATTQAAASTVGAVAWLVPNLSTAATAEFDFQVEVKAVAGDEIDTVHAYTPDEQLYSSTKASDVAFPAVYFPILSKAPDL